MQPSRPIPDNTRPIRIVGSLLAAFVVLSVVIRLLCKDAAGYSAIWPANGVIMVATLGLPPRLSMPLIVSCVGFNLVLNWTTTFGLTDSLLYSLLNACHGSTAALLTRRLCGAAADLMRLRRLAIFASIAIGVSALEALIGEVIGPQGPSLGNLLSEWLFWTSEDALGLLITTPAILCFVRGTGRTGIGTAGRVERWALPAMIIATAFATFSHPSGILFLFIYPLLVILAFRAGTSLVLLSVLLVAIISSGLTAHGHGPINVLAAGVPLAREVMLQSYVVSLFLVAVPASAVLRQRAIMARRLQKLKEDLKFSATHDSLTLLANRKVFRTRLDAHLQSGSGGTVLFIDLDRFKEVNDTLGHQAGDQLLREFSSRLTECVGGSEGLVSRFGGDEFAILIAWELTSIEIGELCAAIIRASGYPYSLAGGLIHVSVCIGIASCRASQDDAIELMRRADIALYAAKRGGRDGYCVFEDDLDQAVRGRRRLEEDLRAALRNKSGLGLHYQLKVDREGYPTGVEALLRWNHPELGPVATDRVIQAAEASGLILPLGAWVLHEAIAFAERWPNLTVAINVSPLQLEQPDFARDILATIAASTIGIDQLELEITETALWRESHHVNGNLKALRDAGIGFALDDFGTGYSSLRHLHHFTAKRVKIDRSFVQSLDVSPEKTALVRAIIQLGHAMGLQVTAEGVETEIHHRFLLDAGIDELQGYYLARPMEEKYLRIRLMDQRSATTHRLPAEDEKYGSAMELDA